MISFINNYRRKSNYRTQKWVYKYNSTRALGNWIWLFWRKPTELTIIMNSLKPTVLKCVFRRWDLISHTNFNGHGRHKDTSYFTKTLQTQKNRHLDVYTYMGMSCLIGLGHVLKLYCLTHWGRVTHICVSKLTIIGSNNGLSPGRYQTIIWTNARILSIGHLGTKFNEIQIGIQTFPFKKMHSKMSSAKWRPFCLGLNALNVPEATQRY